MFDAVDDISTGFISLDSNRIIDNCDKMFLKTFFDYFGKSSLNECLRLGVDVMMKNNHRGNLFHLSPRVICRIPITKRRYMFKFFEEGFCKMIIRINTQRAF